MPSFLVQGYKPVLFLCTRL